MIGVLLTPLELIYAAALRARNARYDRMEPARLEWPVVSVGNLSTGGTGKTPLVIRLAHLLAERGFAPDASHQLGGQLSPLDGQGQRTAQQTHPNQTNTIPAHVELDTGYRFRAASRKKSSG